MEAKRDHRKCPRLHGLCKWHHLLPIWGAELRVKWVVILTPNSFMFFWQKGVRSPGKWPGWNLPSLLQWEVIKYEKMVFDLIFSSCDIPTKRVNSKWQAEVFSAEAKRNVHSSQFWGGIRTSLKANRLGHLKTQGQGMLAKSPMLFNNYWGSR